MDIEMDNNLVDENKKNEPMNQINNESINELDEKNEQMNQINNESINKTDEKNKPDVSSLKPENIEGITGGYLFYNPDGEFQWEVVGRDGYTIEKCFTKESGIATARKMLGENVREINWKQVKFLREAKDKISDPERYIVLNVMDKLQAK